MKKIALLHTAQVNNDLFRQMIIDGSVDGTHVVRDDLLSRAVAAGVFTPELNLETQDVLRGLAEGADVVLLTCSTLGPAADALGAPNILRVDRALAECAVKGGGSVAVVVAVETTVTPTKALFDEEAAKTGAQIEMVMAEDAWPLFQAGDMDGYITSVAKCAANTKADVIALAQASMAPAAKLLPGRKVLSSPEAGLAAALALLA